VALWKMYGNKTCLWLHRFGEPLLHPQLDQFIDYATNQGVPVSFYTNGLLGRRKPVPTIMWEKLANSGLKFVNFSAHYMTVEKFYQNVQNTVEVVEVFDPVKGKHNTGKLGTWAGQVGPKESPSNKACLFKRLDAFDVLWDGTIAPCNMGVEGPSLTITVNDLLNGEVYKHIPHNLCNSCNSMRDEIEYTYIERSSKFDRR